MRERLKSSIVALVTLILVVSAASAAVSTSALAQDGQTDAADDVETSSAHDGDGSWATHRADNARTGSTAADGPSPYGELRWDDSFTGEPVAAPTVTDGTAYLAVETARSHLKKTGAVVAYDTSTGEVQWERTELADPNGAPTVANGTVYVSAEAANPDYRMDSDGEGGLYALDAETGQTEWVRNDSEHWPSTTIHADDRVYAIREPAPGESGESSLVAVAADTGETVWAVDADRLLGAADDTVYAIEDGELVAVAAASGEQVWEDAPTVGRSADVAITDDAIFVDAYPYGGPPRLTAYSTADASVQWNVTYDDDGVSEPAAADGDVFVTTDSNELVRIDGATGKESWRYEPPEGVLSGAPSIANDTVYVGSHTLKETEEPGEGYRGQKQSVLAIDAQSGEQKWGYVTDEDDNTDLGQMVAPSIADGTLYVPAHDNVLDGGNVSPSGSSGYLHVFESSPTEPDASNQPSDGHYENRDRPDVEASISVTEEDPDEEFGSEKTVVLSGNSTTVRSGTVTSYEWDVDGDGTYDQTGESISVTLEKCQFATVTLRVTTDEGETATDSVTLSNT